MEVDDGAVAPAVSSLSVRSTWGPFGSTSGDTVPLTGSVDCGRLDLATDSAGYLQDPDGHLVAVTVTCESQGAGGLLRLGFPDLPVTGTTFEGAASVLGEEITISLTRSSTVVLPLVLLALGIALGLWLLARGPARIISTLRARLLTVQVDLEGSAVQRFRETAGQASWRDLDVGTSATKVIEEIRTSLDGLAWRRKFTLKDDDEQVTDLKGRIQQVEDVVTGLPPLAQDLAELDRLLPVVEDTLLIPRWAAGVRDALLTEGATCEVADFADLRSRAADAVALAGEWPTVAQQVTALRRRIESLEQNHDKRPQQEQQAIRAARTALDGAVRELSNAATTEQVRAVVVGTLAAAVRRTKELDHLQVITDAGFASSGSGRALAVFDLLRRPAPPHAAAVLTRERRASMVAAVVVAALLLLTGLQTLYVGHAFGTVWDCLGALTWGAASGVVTLPLAAAIENHRGVGHVGHRRQEKT